MKNCNPKLDENFRSACGRVMAVVNIKNERGDSDIDVADEWRQLWEAQRSRALDKGYRVRSFKEYQKDILAARQ